MAWKEVNVIEQRKIFISEFKSKKYSIAELSRQFNISRPTAYKWIGREEESGINGLSNQSRARKTQHLATPIELINEIISIRCQSDNKWGPKKIKAHLDRLFPDTAWPSKTTIEKLLNDNGLVTKRKVRRRLAVKTNPLVNCNESNDLWCVDFKGWHLTKDGYKFEPFTLSDAYSRYLLACVKLTENDTEHVWGILDRCFRDYGLPVGIRSDNGPPFATSGVGRLSRLSVKIIKAGVMPEWIDPGCPQQNGRHERMHGTLKNEGIFPELNLDDQVIKLNEFVDYFNDIRPHEALGQKVPSDVYVRSNRNWNGRLKSPEYSSEYEVARVKSCGKMRYKGKEIYVGRALFDEPVGIKMNDEGHPLAYYGGIYLGLVAGNTLEVERRKGRIRKKVPFKVADI